MIGLDFFVVEDWRSMLLLIGIFFDVFGFMWCNVGDGVEEKGGLWVCLIFKVINNFIKYDVFFENYVFVIGFGVDCFGEEIFDIIGIL